jgi:Membrane-associated phospholipid phosphatase
MASAGTTFFFQWEVALETWLQSVLGDSAISVISFFSAFGEQLLLVGVIGFLYWCWDKKFGKFVGINLMVAGLWNPMIKNIVCRRRPYFDNEGIKCLRAVDSEADIYDIAAQDFSFPSGHSSAAASVYGSIARYLKKRWAIIAAVIIIVLIGFSRVTVGVHYPTDVICGWVLGIGVVFLIPWLQKKINNDPLFYAILLLTGIPGFFFCKTNDFYTSFGMTRECLPQSFLKKNTLILKTQEMSLE